MRFDRPDPKFLRAGKEQLKVLMHELHDLKGKKILDIGPGPHPCFAELAKKKSAEIYGIDNDLLNIEDCQRSGHFNGTAQFDARQLAKHSPFENTKFDVVMMSAVMHFLSRKERAEVIHGLRHHCVDENGSGIVVISAPQLLTDKAYPSTYREHRELEETEKDIRARGMATNASNSEKKSFSEMIRKQELDRQNAPAELALMGYTLAHYFKDITPVDIDRHGHTIHYLVASHPIPLNQCPDKPISARELDQVFKSQTSERCL